MEVLSKSSEVIDEWTVRVHHVWIEVPDGEDATIELDFVVDERISWTDGDAFMDAFYEWNTEPEEADLELLGMGPDQALDFLIEIIEED